MYDIEYVSGKKMMEIIETREPKGKFICVDGNIYIGCDNETGDAWTEDFTSREECEKWLAGEE